VHLRFELDHLFICVTEEAPEAESLIQFGLREGSPNQHPGQGTANRRFFFAHAMLELIWVSNASEAQSELSRRTLLYERWSARGKGASPFGICIRPCTPQTTGLPFPGWEYRPRYLPDPLSILVAEAGVDEPMWFYLSFVRSSFHEERFMQHPIGIRELTALRLTTPSPLSSAGARRVLESGILSTQPGPAHNLEIEFDRGQRNQVKDFRPQLPLMFRF
jgi:hypothetical protein